MKGRRAREENKKASFVRSFRFDRPFRSVPFTSCVVLCNVVLRYVAVMVMAAVRVVTFALKNVRVVPPLCCS